MKLTLSSSAALLLLALPALAQGPSNRAPFTATYLHDFKSDIDGGGEVSSDSFNLRLGAPLYRGEGRLIALVGGYSYNSYDFAGGAPGSFAALDPWDEIHTFRLSLPVKWELGGGDWTLFGIPSVRSTGEDGASFDDSIGAGFIGGASYRFSDRLSLGPGVGVSSQLEDNASVFPVILVDWKFAEGWSLTTGPTVGATLGPGLALNWDASDRLRVSVGARYEKLRFRLDEGSGASPGGVGEDRGIPVFGAITYAASEHWRFSLLGGVSFGNELTLEDEGGREILQRDSDPSPFVGLNLSWSF